MAGDRDPSSPTNGLPYIITETEAINDRHVRFHYLLPSGRRRSIVLDGLLVDDALHQAVVNAWEADDYRNRPGRPGRRP